MDRDVGSGSRPPAEQGSEEVRVDPQVRYRLILAYDGSAFHGFAAQPGRRTVSGVLAQAISTVLRIPIELSCAGRTDKGVHALAQVVHFDGPRGIDLARLVKSVNKLGGPDIVVRDAAQVSDDFHARHSATSRRYRYLVLETDHADPLLRRLVWQVAGPLDLRPMKAGADALLGEHDFRSFCRRAPGTSPEDAVPRRVLSASWTEVPRHLYDLGPAERVLRFDIEANAFCHHMVRSVVGTLVDVGRGRRRAADVHALLLAPDRAGSSDPAPSQGLCLVGVSYQCLDR